MLPKTIIHLLSGGLDSVAMLHDLRAQGHFLHCLLIDYRQPHVQELTFAKAHCRHLGVPFTTMELPSLGGLTEQSWIVPNRNAILLSAAVNVACQKEADTVTIGCNADDAEQFPDCRAPFLAAMNDAVKKADCNVEIWAPYLDWPKRKIVKLAWEMGIGPLEIWTCYKSGEKPCGECPACKKLELAME